MLRLHDSPTCVVSRVLSSAFSFSDSSYFVGIASLDCFRRLLEVNTEQGVKEPLEVEDLAVQTTIESPELGISSSLW